MAAGAEFLCGVLGDGVASALWWMAAGAEFPCGVPGGCGHRRCGGWLQGLSFLVMCWEVVWHRRCVGCGWGEFFAICREGIGG